MTARHDLGSLCLHEPAGVEVGGTQFPARVVLGTLVYSSKVQARWYRLWVSRAGTGYEPTGEALFATGAFTNFGSYNNPVMDKLISQTQTSNSLAVFHQYATYAAEQLPYIWIPDPYQIQAVSSKLHGVTFSPFYTLLPEYWYFTK